MIEHRRWPNPRAKGVIDHSIDHGGGPVGIARPQTIGGVLFTSATPPNPKNLAGLAAFAKHVRGRGR